MTAIAYDHTGLERFVFDLALTMDVEGDSSVSPLALEIPMSDSFSNFSFIIPLLIVILPCVLPRFTNSHVENAQTKQLRQILFR